MRGRDVKVLRYMDVRHPPVGWWSNVMITDLLVRVEEPRGVYGLVVRDGRISSKESAPMGRRLGGLTIGQALSHLFSHGATFISLGRL